MTDELDVLSRLTDYHDHIAAPPVPVADDVGRGRRRVARRRRLAAGGAALAVTGIVLAAALVSRTDLDGTPPPARTPTPAPTSTQTHTAIEPVRNGRITSAERYLAGGAGGYAWRAFDPVSDTGLFIAERHPGAADLVVVGRTGPIARLTCARDPRCPRGDNWLSYVATLGPGADEVTVESGDGAALVIGYDGSLRRTIDLTATIAGGAGPLGLRWSRDGSLLAVATVQYPGSGGSVSRVWLVDDEGGDARLAFSLRQDRRSRQTAPSGFDGRGWIWASSGWGWSPDGQSLLLDVVIGTDRSEVVVLRLLPDGAPSPVTAQTLYHSNRNFDWAGNVAWSPDGTRIAVRTRVPGALRKHRITEISAEDGSVIAQHPHNPGWLIWPAREG